jgi:hypothetical protein
VTNGLQERIKFVNRGSTVFGPKKDEVNDKRRKLHNEELNDLYCSPTMVQVMESRRMRWSEHVARMGEGRGVHRFLVGKHEGKRQLGRSIRRWEDNIKADLQVEGCVGMDWIELARDRDRWQSLLNSVMNLRVP